MEDNIKSKLVELGIANANRHVIFDDIFGKIVSNVREEGLRDCMNADDVKVYYNGSKHKVDHIKNCMSVVLRSMVALGFSPRPYTENGNECINSIIKRVQYTRKMNLKEIVQLLRSLTRHQEEQLKLSLMGPSEWSLDKKYKKRFQNDLNRFFFSNLNVTATAIFQRF